MHKFVYLKLARPSTERFGSLIKEIFGPVINSNLGVAEGNFTPPPSLSSPPTGFPLITQKR